MRTYATRPWGKLFSHVPTIRYTFVFFNCPNCAKRIIWYLNGSHTEMNCFSIRLIMDWNELHFIAPNSPLLICLQDKANKRRMLMAIDRRKKHLKNLRLVNYDAFENVCEKLGITYTFPPEYYRRITRRWLAKKAFCIKVNKAHLLKVL